MPKHRPDIVCISALFNTCYNYLELISTAVKETSEKALIVIGGGLATKPLCIFKILPDDIRIMPLHTIAWQNHMKVLAGMQLSLRATEPNSSNYSLRAVHGNDIQLRSI